MARVAAHSDSEESVKDQSKPAEQEDNGKAADPEGESEYEIEEVLDAKRGVFPDVRAIFVSLTAESTQFKNRVVWDTSSNGKDTVLQKIAGLMNKMHCELLCVCICKLKRTVMLQ